MTNRVTSYFFGCRGQAGHYFWPRIPRIPRLRTPHPDLPFPDGNEGMLLYLPGTSPGSYGHIDRGQEVQGASRLTHRAGWTVLAWWDRAGPDGRRACHSSLWAEGTHDYAAMLAIGERDWPRVFADIRRPSAPEGVTRD